MSHPNLNYPVATTKLEDGIVVVKFSYYVDPFEDIPAEPCYEVVFSGSKKIRSNQNVDEDKLSSIGVAIPLTPSYELYLEEIKEAAKYASRKN